MVSHQEVAKAFINGNKATGSRMFTDGTTIWSYGHHFPIALRLSDGSYLFNKDGYSSSTTHHKTYVLRCLSGKIIEASTQEIKSAIEYPNRPIVITNTVQHGTVESCIYNLKQIMEENGLKRFPAGKMVKTVQVWEERAKDRKLLNAL